jgi:hypothetical protein
MNISKIANAFALTLAVTALPAMALNTQGTYNNNYPNSNYPNNGQTHQRHQKLDVKAMDRNGDGIVTRAEWTGDDASFQRHDRNGDGVISAADRQQRGNNGRQGNYQRQNGNWRSGS